MNTSGFPLAENEEYFGKNITRRSDSYDQAITYISNYLKRLGYQVAESIGIKGDHNKALVITNLLAKNQTNQIELACYVCFPKRKAKISSKRISERAIKLAEHWGLVGVFLVFESPKRSTFPFLATRLFKAVGKEKLRIFTLNGKTGEIKGIFNF